MNTPRPPVHYAFAQLAAPVSFADGTEELIGVLETINTGWTSRPVSNPDAGPFIRVSREGGSYRIDAPWLDTPVRESSPDRAAGNLAVDLTEAWLAERPDALSLHCGAALFAGRLVVFPSRSRGGKSTLTARIAAAGIPVFCDDVLPLCGADDREGMSLGMAVRLRLPLPAAAGSEFREYVAARSVLRTSRNAYLRPPSGQAPVFGRAAALGAIVLLDRTADATAAELGRVSRGDGLHELILQLLRSTGEAGRLPLARLSALVARLPCYSLRYSDLDDAFACLAGTFTDWDDTPAEAGGKAVSVAERPRFAGGNGCRYRHAAGVVAEATDDGVFLVPPDDRGVYRLNAVGSGLWRLLEQPLSADEAVTILTGAFPDAGRTRIAGDVDALFAELMSGGFLVAEPGG